MIEISALAILMVTDQLLSSGARVGGCRARPEWATRRAAHPARSGYFFGQLFSMSLSTVSVSFCPVVQATMPRQKLPEPTSPGMESEPSNTASCEEYAALAMMRMVLFG